MPGAQTPRTTSRFSERSTRASVTLIVIARSERSIGTRKTVNLRIATPWALLLLGLATPMGGCGPVDDGLGRREVTGMVTLDGQPLASGSIQFEPQAGNTGTIVSGGGIIQSGHYRIPRDKGLRPGKYKVSVFSSGEAPGGGESEPPGNRTPPPPEKVPAKYNVATTLTAEVKADSPNSFNFDMKK
jgi:hypothetical protein